MNKRKEEIQSFILENVENHAQDIIPLTAKHFNVTKSAISQHIRTLLQSDLLEASGKGRNRLFTLKETLHVFEEKITPELQEDQIWSTKLKPLLPELKENVINICHYGFTEIFNNAIDHSTSKKALISIKFDARKVSLNVVDFGIGIFKKIQNGFQLQDERQALLELAKGKLTTDPSNHSGEGIFFTSRVFDDFSIYSGELFFSHATENNDWLISAKVPLKGTMVSMTISRSSEHTLQNVFNLYAGEASDYSFNKTIVALTLSQYEGEQLVSRSQAKRILNRVEKFKEVVLDFSKVDFIGRAFADEIFRVYQNQHPDIQFVCINANKDIEGLIQGIKGQNTSD
jgi:anti-sigma regulatory factor (Ser/Thr protein kinase)/DNA-binding transcriptional ArsR family regulator